MWSGPRYPEASAVFRLSEAADALAANRQGADVEISGVTTDSRAVGRGDLFVALRGERFDGHAFVDAALAAGAAAALVSDPLRVATPDAPLLVADDTRAALGQLGAWWRGRFAIPVAAVTGSNGKTTVKDMVAAILRAHFGEDAVLATQGNLNNDIGVPIMLLRLRARHRCAVLEMGMNHLGEIAYLTRLARPDVAAINNAGTAHIGELGSRENIARAKGEILEGLPAHGTAVLNADDAFLPLWRGLAGSHDVIDFALDRPAAVTAEFAREDDGSRITLRTPSGVAVARLRVPGVHNVRNALCAAATAHALGIPDAAIAAGLSGYGGTEGRLQRKRGPKGALLVDDTYNANVESMKAAIDWLAGTRGRRVLVIGDMGELGADSPRLHAEVGSYARDRGIEHLLALGDACVDAVRAFGPGARHFADVAALAAAAADLCEPGAVVLVKGSRFMRMERVVERLAADPAQVVEDH